MNVSWALFKSQMGLCVGSTAIFLGIMWALQFVSQMIASGFQVAGAAGGRGGGGGGGGGGGEEALMLGLFFGVWLVQQLITVYLTLGQVNLMLKIARGEPAQIGDMFTVGRYFWRSLWASFLFGLMVMAGALLLIFPMFIVWVMFFPYNYYLIDQDVGIIDSLQGARQVTSGNRWTIFVLALVAFGVTFAGLLACCVGVLFSGGYVALMAAVAYQMATGRPVARA